MKTQSLIKLSLFLAVLIHSSASFGASCNADHGTLTFFTDSNTNGEGYVGFHHHNDAPFTQGVTLTRTLDPDVLIDTSAFTATANTITNFAGSLATDSENVSTALSSSATLPLSTLDMSSHLSAVGDSWPTTVGGGVEKHAAVIQRKVVRQWDGIPGGNAAVTWQRTRNYVLSFFEYRIAGSAEGDSNTGYDGENIGFLLDANGEQLRIRVTTEVQESGVTKATCQPVRSTTGGSVGYGVHIYPRFHIDATSLDTDAEISALHAPALNTGYAREVILHRRPQ